MLRHEHFELRETAVTIITDETFVAAAKDAVFDARGIVERKISDDPFFGTTYDPYPPDAGDDWLIKRMCNASEIAGVGPMAAVAGAVATYVVETLEEMGCTHAVVDNGGDIAILCDRPVVVGIYSGTPLDGVSLRFRPSGRIRGVCSSSGRIGPSVSLGDSDICTVFSHDVILADAAATALGNLLCDTDLEDAVGIVGDTEGVDGCIASAGGNVAMFGDIPELVRTEGTGKVTRIEL